MALDGVRHKTGSDRGKEVTPFRSKMSLRGVTVFVITLSQLALPLQVSK